MLESGIPPMFWLEVCGEVYSCCESVVKVLLSHFVMRIPFLIWFWEGVTVDGAQELIISFCRSAKGRKVRNLISR